MRMPGCPAPILPPDSGGPAEAEAWCSGNGTADPAKVEGIQLIYAGPHCHALATP